MHTEHDLFHPPTNENQIIWRYLDITKLLDLINSTSLYFTRADFFEDIFEGSLPKKTLEVRTNYYEELVKQDQVSTEYTPEFFNKYNQELKKEMALNCWHMNDYESAAMWKLYLKSNEGIAIQSTYRRLVSSFQNIDVPIFIGKVNYIDYEKAFIPFSNLLSPFLHKRKSFEHERELRCLIWQTDNSPNANYNLNSGGVKIKIDLHELIENVYISPDSPAWLTNLLQDIIQKYSLEISIINSRIKALPLF